MSPRLSEDVGITTGAGGSVGRAAALALAREGALVVGCDRDGDATEATVAPGRTVGGTLVSLQPCQPNKPAELAHTSAKAAIIW
jgi:NAD(P)-dependent dehydrogenase (short-subunit alcohol dehydrogenase family)